MPSKPQFTKTELSQVETLLQQFSPTASTINRDALMYEAGWAAASARVPTKTNWLWAHHFRRVSGSATCTNHPPHGESASADGDRTNKP